MNTGTVVIQINSAINLLRGLQGGINDLPQRHARTIPGANHIGDVIRRLEIAKAELSGEPHPLAPIVPIDESLLEIIDN